MSNRKNSYSRAGAQRNIKVKNKQGTFLLGKVRLSIALFLTVLALLAGMGSINEKKAEIEKVASDITRQVKKIDELALKTLDKRRDLEKAIDVSKVCYLAAQKLGMKKATEENVVFVNALGYYNNVAMAKNNAR